MCKRIHVEGLGLAVAALLSLVASAAAMAADTNVIINEIMYHPPLELDGLQYVEVYNRGNTPVDLSRWSFNRGIEYTFPDGTKLGPDAYLVVCRNTQAFTLNYGTGFPILGNFNGKLSHHGEKLELSNARGEVVDAVKYADRAPWPTGADGRSASLERICPFAPGKDPANWAASALPVMEKPAGTPGRRNSSHAAHLPPVISKVDFKPPPPSQPVTVSAEVADAAGVQSVDLLWHLARSGSELREKSVPMRRVAGDSRSGTYQGVINGMPAGTLVRFQIRALGAEGESRLSPGPNEPRPTFSYSTYLNTNTARVPFAFVLNVSEQRFRSQIRVAYPRVVEVPCDPTRGSAALIYLPPGGGEVVTYDYVFIRPRKGGWKMHFPKDQTLNGMTGVNVIFENSPRWLLSEPMAYELYRLAGVPGELTEHWRLWMDGQLLGYYLVIEQPNKSFLARNQRNDNGSIYKATYMGQGLTGQHLKKNHWAEGFDDLMALYRGLAARSGEQQWEYIQQNFNVEEFANYYAVNMCIQNWDGFFNNYYLYHDSADTGKWEMYGWDEDKTWGDYDGAPPHYNWYTFPLTFGMNSRYSAPGSFGFGGLGGPMGAWERPPGWFSGPLLANPQFRRAFLLRLRDICNTVFTEQKMVPLINALEQRLEPEIPVWAQVRGMDAEYALRAFHDDIQSLRNQVKYRRKYILLNIPRDRAMQ